MTMRQNRDLHRHHHSGKLFLFVVAVTIITLWKMGFMGAQQAYAVLRIEEFAIYPKWAEVGKPREEPAPLPVSTAPNVTDHVDIEKETEQQVEQPPKNPPVVERRKSHGFGVDVIVVAQAWEKYFLKEDREVEIQWQEGRWLYAEGVCEAQDFSCYFEKPNMDPKPENLTEIIRRLTVPNPKFQKAIDQVAVPAPENCGVTHVRHADITLNFGWGNSSETPLNRYLPLSEYVEKFRQVAPNITNVVLLTDDQDVIDEVPKYDNKNGLKFHYLKRKRFRGAEGGWENHFPSGSRWQEMVTIMQIKQFISGCTVWVGTQSSFARVLHELIDPRPVYHVLQNRVPPKLKEPKSERT